jgi:hypothetical protein
MRRLLMRESFGQDALKRAEGELVRDWVHWRAGCEAGWSVTGIGHKLKSQDGVKGVYRRL